MKVRLKKNCNFDKVTICQGSVSVTHDWIELPEGLPLTEDMEVEGKTEEPKVEVVVEELKEEPVAELEPVEEPIVEAKPKKVKKKKRRR